MIIAIGGGEVYNHETYAIDQFIVASSNIDNRNLLLFQQPRDAQSYVEVMRPVYIVRLYGRLLAFMRGNHNF